jgi:hypothetical protein
LHALAPSSLENLKFSKPVSDLPERLSLLSNLLLGLTATNVIFLYMISRLDKDILI